MEHQPNPNIYTDEQGNQYQVCTACGDWRKYARFGPGVWVYTPTCTEEPECPGTQEPRNPADLLNDLYEQT